MTNWWKMINQKQPPREFWLAINRCTGIEKLFYSEENCYDEMKENDNIFHLVEMSEVRRLRDKVIKEQSFVRQKEFNLELKTKSYDKERALRLELQKALEEIKSLCCSSDKSIINVIVEALAKCREHDGRTGCKKTK